MALSRDEIAVRMMQGLLSGNSQFETPTDDLLYAFAVDAVRMADALLAVLESPERLGYVPPKKPEHSIYMHERERLEQEAREEEAERERLEQEAQAQ